MKNLLHLSDAVIEIIREARTDRGSLTAFKRTLRALRALGCDVADCERVLGYFDYLRADSSAFLPRVDAEWQAFKARESRRLSRDPFAGTVRP